MVYKFGETSNYRLDTCHRDLVLLMDYAILHEDCPCDFTIVCGVRGREDQEKAFSEGNSRAVFGKSPHNFKPSYAVDVAPYVPGVGIAWTDTELFNALARHIKKCANELGVLVAWGGDFKSINDKPHWELTYWRDMKKELAK